MKMNEDINTPATAQNPICAICALRRIFTSWEIPADQLDSHIAQYLSKIATLEVPSDAELQAMQARGELPSDEELARAL
jgi:hypothetical protein